MNKLMIKQQTMFQQDKPLERQLSLSSRIQLGIPSIRRTHIENRIQLHKACKKKVQCRLNKFLAHT